MVELVGAIVIGLWGELAIGQDVLLGDVSAAVAEVAGARDKAGSGWPGRILWVAKAESAGELEISLLFW